MGTLFALSGYWWIHLSLVVSPHEGKILLCICIICYYHHQIGSIHLSNFYHIFPRLSALDVCYIIFCHLLHTDSGKTGILFSLLLCSLWWVQIFGYSLACRAYSFVCALHHLIIIMCKLIWRHWTYKMPVIYILPSVWERLSIFS